MNAKVTIVTSVFNGEAYLEKTIQSVLNQTYKNIEYIIIDGGSTDRTVDIIKKYESNIAYWLSEKDDGMYDGINKGFNKATGEIFAYLNADDLYYENTTIENIVNYFVHDKDLSLVFGNVEFIDYNDKHMYFYKAVELHSSFIKYLHRVPFAQQTAFWKAKVYKNLGGFDSKLKYVADSKFFFSILFNKKYRYKKINKYIGKFRWHEDGFSTAHFQKMNKESNQMRKELGCFKRNYIIKLFLELFIKFYNLNNILKKKFNL